VRSEHPSVRRHLIVSVQSAASLEHVYSPPALEPNLLAEPVIVPALLC
jgi:hypothetical protein